MVLINGIPLFVLIFVLIFVFSIAGLSIWIIYLIVSRDESSISDFHKLIVVGSFSTVVTATVILLGLITLADTGANTLNAKTAFLNFNFTGAPAVWIVVFWFTTRTIFSKSRKVTDLHAPAPNINNDLAPSRNYESHHQGLGFQYYRQWKNGLKKFRPVIDKSREFHFVEDLLPKIFYHGQFDLLKPQKVTNTTLFIFSKGKAVKFQRIQGEERTNDTQCSKVYLPQTKSTPGGELSCLHFIRSDNAIIETARHEHGDWKETPFNDIDIMLLAIYENDDVENGDYVYVDVSKYVDLERMDTATVEIAIVSDRQMVEFNVWEVSACLESRERPMPLMFRNLDDTQAGKRAVADVKKNIEHIVNMFEGWDTILDQAFDGHLGELKSITGKEVKEFLHKVKSALASDDSDADTISFQELFRHPPAVDCVISKLKHQQNVILSTFAWVQQVPKSLPRSL